MKSFALVVEFTADDRTDQATAAIEDEVLSWLTDLKADVTLLIVAEERT